MSFHEMWDGYSDSMKSSILELYPGIGAIATSLTDVTNASAIFADELERAAGMDFAEYAKTMKDIAMDAEKLRTVEAAKENGFADQLTELLNAYDTGGIEKLRNTLHELYEENAV